MFSGFFPNIAPKFPMLCWDVETSSPKLSPDVSHQIFNVKSNFTPKIQTHTSQGMAILRIWDGLSREMPLGVGSYIPVVELTVGRHLCRTKLPPKSSKFQKRTRYEKCPKTSLKHFLRLCFSCPKKCFTGTFHPMATTGTIRVTPGLREVFAD